MEAHHARPSRRAATGWRTSELVRTPKRPFSTTTRGRACYEPKAFLMENVYALGYRNQNRAVFRRFQERVRAAGYSFDHGVLIAADFGVPQNGNV